MATEAKTTTDLGKIDTVIGMYPHESQLTDPGAVVDVCRRMMVS